MFEYLYKTLIDLNKLEPDITLCCFNYSTDTLVAIQGDSKLIYMHNFKLLFEQKLKGSRYFVFYPEDIAFIKSELLYIQNNKEVISVSIDNNRLKIKHLISVLLNKDKEIKLLRVRSTVKLFKYRGLVTLLKLTSKKFRVLFGMLKTASE